MYVCMYVCMYVHPLACWVSLANLRVINKKNLTLTLFLIHSSLNQARESFLVDLAGTLEHH